MTTRVVPAGSERPRFHRPCRLGQINPGFGTKLLDLLQPQINNLDPTPNQPATTRNREIRRTRGQIQRLDRRSTQFGTSHHTLECYTFRGQ